MEHIQKDQKFLSTLSDYIAIARPDHWFKNVFMIPGLIIPFGFHLNLPLPSFLKLFIAFTSLCLIASSNYVINEVLDAPFDKHHPKKQHRPIPSGRIKISIAYIEWIALMVIGLSLAALINVHFFVTMAALWTMGCIYNIPPVRSKDKPFLDVISEAVNNPLRLLAGWYVITTVIVPPASLVVSYWAIGCYFMAIKRLAEYKVFDSKEQAIEYRKSFQYYTFNKLLVSIMCYAASTMLFFGAFIGRYRLEMILSFPFIAIFMAIYLGLGLQSDGVVQTPEKLYKNKLLMLTVAVCVVTVLFTFFVDMPIIENIFKQTGE